MAFALTCFAGNFVGAFAGAFAGVVAARAVGAWMVRRTFERMRAAASSSRAAVPNEVRTMPIDRPTPECCVDALPDGWAAEPVGFSWVCGGCGQRWEKTRPAMAERAAAADDDSAPEGDCG